MRLFYILVHGVYRDFDKNGTKTVKIGKLLSFCLFRCQIRPVLIQNFIYLFSKHTGQHILSLLTKIWKMDKVFEILSRF